VFAARKTGPLVEDPNIESFEHNLQLLLLVLLRHPLGPPTQIIRDFAVRPRTSIMPVRLRSALISTVMQPLPETLQTAARLRRRTKSNRQVVVLEQVLLVIWGNPRQEVQDAVEVEIRHVGVDDAHAVHDGQDFIANLLAGED